MNADTPIHPYADGPSHANRAVFLDRDGVINRPLVRGGNPFPPRSLEEFEILPGVHEACELLKGHGYVLIVATNQPDVGRGLLPREAVDTIHRVLLDKLPIDHVLTCFHAGVAHGDPCQCRKPLPGMLLRAAEEFKIDLANSFMIGDRWRDVECGFNAGCRTFFVDWGYRETLKRQPDYRADNLLAAAHLIQNLTFSTHART
ncbi:MAG TPA: HAD family hydrolase [Chthoniobacterales bacterium]|nr:HAD family hydrolase [Chthoniobacterales bacterium]